MSPSRRFILLSSILQLLILAALGPWMLSANNQVFGLLDYSICIGFYVYTICLLGFFHTLLTARLGTWPLFVAEALTTFYLVASSVVSYRFGVHLDHPVVLAIFARSDHNYGLTFSAADGGLIFGVISAITLAHWGLWKLAKKRGSSPPLSVPPGRRSVSSAIRIAAAVLLCAAYLWFVVANLPEGEPYQPPERAIPGYALVKRFYTQHSAVNAYYRPPLLSRPLPDRPNIIILVADTFRYDLISPGLTPNLFALSKKKGCTIADRHYSGSTITSYGTFPLLTGMNAYNYQPFTRAGLGSAALRIFRENQYALHGFDASGLAAYDPPVVSAADFDSYRLVRGTRAFKDDAEVASELIKRREVPTSKNPLFLFGFFFSTHAPYDSPGADESSLQGKPLEGADNLSLGLYRAAARHVDNLVGKILRAYGEDLENGRLAFAFTGDHGEEFGEFGGKGHAGESFQDVRVRVPLVLCVPKHQPLKIKLSTNADVLPTILGAMGAPEGELSENFDGIPLSIRERHVATVSAAGFPHDSSLVMQVVGKRKYLFELTTPELSSLELKKVYSDRDLPATNGQDQADVKDAADSLIVSMRRWLQIVNSADPLDHGAEAASRTEK